MVTKFDAQLDDVMKQDGVVGVICTDNSGLMLSARGVAQESQAGTISSIAALASKLFPQHSEQPIISIEGEETNLLIRDEAKIVVGIFKKKE